MWNSLSAKSVSRMPGAIAVLLQRCMFGGGRDQRTKILTDCSLLTSPLRPAIGSMYTKPGPWQNTTRLAARLLPTERKIGRSAQHLPHASLRACTGVASYLPRDVPQAPRATEDLDSLAAVPRQHRAAPQRLIPECRQFFALKNQKKKVTTTDISGWRREEAWKLATHWSDTELCGLAQQVKQPFGNPPSLPDAVINAAFPITVEGPAVVEGQPTDQRVLKGTHGSMSSGTCSRALTTRTPRSQRRLRWADITGPASGVFDARTANNAVQRHSRKW